MTQPMNNHPLTALIIGGGPAGTSCALWLKMLGHSPAILEKTSRLGGLQNKNPFPNEWIVGHAGATGEQIGAKIHDHIGMHGIPVYFQSSVISVSRSAAGAWETLAGSAQGPVTIRSKYLVLATGVKPVADNFIETGSVLIGPGRKIVDFDYRAKRVAILGGGDNALENYLFVKDRGAAAVHVFARRLRARREFVKRVPADAISVRAYQAHQQTMSVDGEPFDAFLVFYGWAPVNPIAGHVALETDARGFIETDHRRRTSAHGIYAIGEVTQKNHPCVVTSMSDGIICAKDIQLRIEASEDTEGAVE